MAKSIKAPSSQFVCSECGYVTTKWLGKCPACNEFNTLQEEIITPEPTQTAGRTNARVSVNRPTPLCNVGFENFHRIKSGIAELDTVLGGGIVPGSLVLLGGDPGIGKSTLLTQVSAHLAAQHSVLYVSAEESCSQVKMRCQRLGLNSDTLLLLNETC